MLKLKRLPVIASDKARSSPVLDFLSRLWIYLMRSPTPGISRPRALAPELGLYAEASAPEGALYVRGQPLDYLPGTSSLYVGR